MENSGNKQGETITVWVVQKLDWQYNDHIYSLMEDLPIKAFLDRAQAQKYCDELTAQEQDRLVSEVDVTFHFGGLERMTSLSEDELEQRLTENGLAAPRFYESVHSRSWWNRIWKTFSLNQKAKLWRLFDRIEFYEVIEVELLP